MNAVADPAEAPAAHVPESRRAPVAYRAFQVVYGILVIQFLIPAISYVVDRRIAERQLDTMNRLLGGGPFPVEAGELWHMLAVGNVMTLAFMCALLLWDVRRFFPVLPALAFLKGFSSLYSLWLGFSKHIPAFFGVFVLDGVTTAAMIFFAVWAHRSLGHTRSPAAPLGPLAHGPRPA